MQENYRDTEQVTDCAKALWIWRIEQITVIKLIDWMRYFHIQIYLHIIDNYILQNELERLLQQKWVFKTQNEGHQWTKPTNY